MALSDRIMDREHGGYLYRYMSLAGNRRAYVRDAIVESKVFYAAPATFNDPFDCSPIISPDATREQLRKFLKEDLKRKRPSFVRGKRRAMLAAAKRDWTAGKLKDRVHQVALELSEDIKNSIGVLCFSELGDNLLMWAHYADSHRGVCLKFKAGADIPFTGTALPVLYQQLRPHWNPVFDDPGEGVEKGLLTKSVDWRTEREWRAFSMSGPGVQRFPPDLLEAVIVGCNIDPKAQEEISEWVRARRRSLQILAAQRAPEAYQVNFAPVG